MSRFAFGTRSKRCLEGVHPDLCRVVRRAMEMTDTDFGVHCGLRTEAEQAELVRTGASRTMRSRHLTGHAVDLHPWIHGAIPWKAWPPWKHLAEVMARAAHTEGVEIEWGGDWKSFRDGPHFQLPWSTYP